MFFLISPNPITCTASVEPVVDTGSPALARAANVIKTKIGNTLPLLTCMYSSDLEKERATVASAAHHKRPSRDSISVIADRY